VYLWSSAGAAYAAEAAEVLGVADLVDGCFGKRHEPDILVDFAVDDDASVVESYGGYRVEPFEGDPRDEELLRAAEAVEAWGVIWARLSALADGRAVTGRRLPYAGVS
jgi:hypothetical protein